jgi:uncharacterized protein
MCGRSPCGAGLTILSVEPNGDVFPCDNMFREKAVPIGNLSTSTIESLETASLNMKRITPVYKRIKCESCMYKRMCAGKCMACSDWDGSDDFDEDYCLYSKNIHDFLMEEISKNELDSEFYLDLGSRTLPKR